MNLIRYMCESTSASQYILTKLEYNCNARHKQIFCISLPVFWICTDVCRRKHLSPEQPPYL